MNPGPSKEKGPQLESHQKAALLSLLGDEDPVIYRSIRTKILSFGPAVIPWMREFKLSSDPVLRRRTQEIIAFLDRQNLDDEFLSFCLSQGEDFNVEEGVFFIAKTEYPLINLTGYKALLDSFAQDLKEKISSRDDPEVTLDTINTYLFGNLRFTGNEDNYYDPENSYLNRVIDRRTGNPISLCLLYLFICKRLGLPVAGIGLPGHFVCRFQSPTREVYIDAFNRGKLLTKADCIKFLHHTNHTLQEGHLMPLSSRRILLRICANLHQIYTQMELPAEVERFQRYLVALAK
jgi:regulator of sirC expression with transglutaminase-like and TPR domain